MRILMSLLRILFGVSLGVGYFAGLAYLPYPYSALLFCVFYWLLAAGLFYHFGHSGQANLLSGLDSVPWSMNEPRLNIGSTFSFVCWPVS